MSGFVQVIEWSTTRYAEVEALQDAWRDRFPSMGPRRITVCKDRASETGYVTLVEFASYEDAMRNSEDPATGEFAARMMALCDGPAVFHDLDVVRTEIRTEDTAAVPTARAAGRRETSGTTA